MTTSSDLLFISWSGKYARAIALALEKIVFRSYLFPKLKVFVSPYIRPGDRWPDELKDSLARATHALGVITDHSTYAPWLLFEAGHLAARLNKFPMLLFDVTIPGDHPLALYQQVKGDRFENIVKVAVECADPTSQRLTEDALLPKSAEWNAEVGKYRAVWTPDARKRVRSAAAKILSIVDVYQQDGTAVPNQCFQEIVTKAVEDLASTLGKADASRYGDGLGIGLQRMHYPEYLDHLQKSASCTVKAIAVVDDVEEFWSELLGRRLAESTQPGSQRVFVFKSRAALEKHWNSVVWHSRRYHVYVTSYQALRSVGRPYDSDFSIITHPQDGSTVLAEYDDARWSIIFRTSDAEIERRRKVLDKLLRSSCYRVNPSASDSTAVPTEADLMEKLAERLFPRDADGAQWVQMSERISAEEYDLYEEDHPYFREMMDRMLEHVREVLPLESSGVRLLELGAGTGHFTKRLAQQPYKDCEIVAVEYDKECWNILHKKFLVYPGINTELANSVDYDPDGKFEVVVSSFAEHHISPDQKPAYLANVVRNLKPNGRFVVGDEFLRQHDRNNRAEHHEALRRYHGFIIDLAKQRGYFGLARLENEALLCGLDGVVDFKMPLREYLEFAERAGLECVERSIISPEDKAEELGGIHVLVFRRKLASSQTGDGSAT